MSFLFCLSELNIRFTQQLVGQPLVHKLVLNSVTSHLTNPNPSKALVLSLHGSTGTGLSMNFRFIFNVFFLFKGKILLLNMSSKVFTVRVSKVGLLNYMLFQETLCMTMLHTFVNIKYEICFCSRNETR